ncbi:MAG TPA: hypothetical protein VNE39_07775 [Planctomycetota bacterium]|nr:hypothetical protein [Planctomycetota bacterium]
MLRRPALTAALALLAASAHAQLSWNPHVREVADFVLAQQNQRGCIPDAPEGLRANEAGAMGRSLLAAAYAWRTLSRLPYRNAWREGIKWLAVSMERGTQWDGTWRYAYAGKPPHVPLPSSPDGIAHDARGLTSAAGLFAYHVALYVHFTADETVSNACRPHVQAALDFVLEKNRGRNHLFYRGWYQPKEKGTDAWELCRKQYATDQADLLLGLWAGSWLVGHARYRIAAERLEREIGDRLFDKRHRAFGIALDEAGSLIPPAEDVETHVVQGYLTWVLGLTKETEQAMKWLDARLAPDGSFRRRRSDPAPVLPAAAFCLGASRVAAYSDEMRKTRRWLRDYAVAPKGGVRALAAPDASTRNDLAGWVILAWLGPDPRPFTRPLDKPAHSLVPIK